MKRFRVTGEEIAEQYVQKYLPFAIRHAQNLCDSGVIAEGSRTLVAAKLLYCLLDIRGVRPDDAAMRQLGARIEQESHSVGGGRAPKYLVGRE